MKGKKGGRGGREQPKKKAKEQNDTTTCKMNEWLTEKFSGYFIYLKGEWEKENDSK